MSRMAVLVSGGPPVKMEVADGQSTQGAERQIQALRNFSWTDDGGPDTVAP